MAISRPMGVFRGGEGTTTVECRELSKRMDDSTPMIGQGGESTWQA